MHSHDIPAAHMSGFSTAQHYEGEGGSEDSTVWQYWAYCAYS